MRRHRHVIITSPGGPPLLPAPPRPFSRICWPSLSPGGILTSICSPFGRHAARASVRSLFEAHGRLHGEVLPGARLRTSATAAAKPAEQVGEQILRAEAFGRVALWAMSVAIGQVKWKSPGPPPGCPRRSRAHADRSRAGCRFRRSDRHRISRASLVAEMCSAADFLEADILRRGIAALGIGVMLLGERPERLLDFCIAGVSGNASTS